MKRRILTLLFSALALSAFAFGSVGCVNDEKNKHTHEYGDWTVVTDATCTEAGEKKRVCACGEYETEEIPPLGHDFADCERGEAVLSEEGHSFRLYRQCRRCGIDAYILESFNGETETELTVPSTFEGKPVTAIGKNVFYGLEKLKSVNLGDSIEEIGELAFADCFNLETVVFGKSVKAIGDYAFSQCINLAEVNLPSGVESIGECAFVSCRGVKKVTLNEGLKSIGDCAFGGCVSLPSFVMPDSVTSIGWGVLMFNQGGEGWFEGPDTSNSLTELVISKSITEIPDYAFSKTNISSVKIQGKVKTIRYSSFYGCGLLQSVILPKSVSRIESYAFYRCSALTSVFYEGTEEEWNKISIGKNGNDISTATKYFYSETQLEKEGNFWHYENGAPAVW